MPISDTEHTDGLCWDSHLEVVCCGVEFATALMLTAERLLTNMLHPGGSGILALQHDLENQQVTINIKLRAVEQVNPPKYSKESALTKVLAIQISACSLSVSSLGATQIVWGITPLRVWLKTPLFMPKGKMTRGDVGRPDQQRLRSSFHLAANSSTLHRLPSSLAGFKCSKLAIFLKAVKQFQTGTV